MPGTGRGGGLFNDGCHQGRVISYAHDLSDSVGWDNNLSVFNQDLRTSDVEISSSLSSSECAVGVEGLESEAEHADSHDSSSESAAMASRRRSTRLDAVLPAVVSRTIAQGAGGASALPGSGPLSDRGNGASAVLLASEPSLVLRARANRGQVGMVSTKDVLGGAKVRATRRCFFSSHTLSLSEGIRRLAGATARGVRVAEAQVRTLATPDLGVGTTLAASRRWDAAAVTGKRAFACGAGGEGQQKGTGVGQDAQGGCVPSSPGGPSGALHEQWMMIVGSSLNNVVFRSLLFRGVSETVLCTPDLRSAASMACLTEAMVGGSGCEARRSETLVQRKAQRGENAL